MRRTREPEREHRPATVEQIDAELTAMSEDKGLSPSEREREVDILLDLRLVAARREKRPAAA